MSKFFFKLINFVKKNKCKKKCMFKTKKLKNSCDACSGKSSQKNESGLKFSISKLKINETAEILFYDENIEKNIKRRLLELGFITGQKIKLLQTSFLGDVLLLEINGYLISLRNNIANKIACRRI